MGHIDGSFTHLHSCALRKMNAMWPIHRLMKQIKSLDSERR